MGTKISKAPAVYVDVVCCDWDSFNYYLSWSTGQLDIARDIDTDAPD